MRFSKSLFCNLACAALLANTFIAAQTSSIRQQLLQCDEKSGVLCTERLDSPAYEYIGHDEPSLLFYSNEQGAGYTNIYRLRLPKDSPVMPKQDGRGGTWNFQLHPAFWFGMAMCDDQSSPNPGGSPSAGPNIKCVPDSDANVYD